MSKISICKKICRKISEWAWEDKIESLECSLIRSRNECKQKTEILQNLEEDLKDSKIDYSTLSTELKIIKLQNKKMDSLLHNIEKEKESIFGVKLNHTGIFINDEEIKTIIKENGTRARTLFNLEYTVELLNVKEIQKIVNVFDISKVSDNENTALHIKSVFESTQFSESSFGIARNKNKYFNIFIGTDKKLYIIDLEEKTVSKYNSENRFTQYWI